MASLSKMLGSSFPCDELLEHRRNVLECVELMKPILETAFQGDMEKVHTIADVVFSLEHKADEHKNKLRNKFPKSLWKSVSRYDLLSYIRKQDSIADKVEDMSVMLLMRKLWIPRNDGKRDFEPELWKLVEYSQKAAYLALDLTNSMCERKLPDSEEIMKLIQEINQNEHDADIQQFRLLRMVLNDNRAEIHFSDQYVMMEIIRAVGDIANKAESMSDYFRLMIAE